MPSERTAYTSTTSMAIWVIPDSPGTCWGVLTDPVEVPLPSVPDWLDPQAHTVPSVSSAALE